MDKRIKKLWTAALRSGKYKQGDCALRDGNKFCCLGVLCDIHRKETGGRWTKDAWGSSLYADSQDYLPPLVAKWAGLGRSRKIPAGKFTLVAYNDGEDGAPKKSFSELAEIIDAKL